MDLFDFSDFIEKEEPELEFNFSGLLDGLSDEAPHGQFDGLKPEPEPDYEFESEKLLRGLESEFQKIEEEFKKESVQLRAIEEEEAELRRQLKLLAQRKAEYEPKVKTYRFDINRIKRSITEAEYKLAVDKANAEQKKNLEEQGAHFDEVTAHCKWRERAFRHQIDGAHFLASAKRAICADVMGLGKSLQILMTLDMLEARNTIIVCPGEVASVFEREVNRWTGDARVVLNLSRKTKAEQKLMLKKFLPKLLERGGRPVTIINFESWNRDKSVLQWLQEAGFDSMVIDEAHNIKETSKNQYKGCAQIALSKNKCPVDNCNTIFERTATVDICPEHGMTKEPEESIRYLYCMTGTPILNKPRDIYSSLHLIAPYVFTTEAQFNRTYADYNGEGWQFDAQARLAKEISGFYLRRTLDDANITLPPQDEILHEIEINEEDYPLQYEIIRMVREEAQLKIKDAEDQDTTLPFTSILAMITRSRQAAVWPGGIWVNKKTYDANGNELLDDDLNPITERVHVGQYYQESAKLDEAEKLYYQLTNDGHRVVFFSQFTEALKEMKRRLRDEVVLYTGETSESQRELIKNNFDASVGEEAKWKGVLCHYKTAGAGLTLTSATVTIILDEEWNEGKKSQAYDRTHRIGQTRNTQVHVLRHVGEDSIDQWLAELIANKANMVNGFNISMAELKEAFK